MRVLYLTDSLSDLDGVGRYGVRLIEALEREDDGFGAEILLARKHRPTSPSVPDRWKCSVALPPDYFFYMSPARFWGSFFASLPRVVASRGPLATCTRSSSARNRPRSRPSARA